MRDHKKSNQENLVSALDLPKDLLLGMPFLNFCGNRELVIENHHGIISYDCQQVIITSKRLTITIDGKSLCVETYTTDILRLTGIFESIRFHPC